MAAFVERVRCPLCSSGAATTLRSIDFGHPSVWHYIEHRYEGRARRRELAGRPHEIARCDRAFERMLRPAEALRTLAGRLAPGGVARSEAQDAKPAAKAVTAPYWSAGDDALRPLENVNAFTARASLVGPRSAAA